MWPDLEEDTPASSSATDGQPGKSDIEDRAGKTVEDSLDSVHAAISTTGPTTHSPAPPDPGPLAMGTIPATSVKEHNTNVPQGQRGDLDGASVMAGAGTA